MKVYIDGRIDFYDGIFVGLPRLDNPYPVQENDLAKFNTKYTKKEQSQYKYGFQFRDKWINGGWTKQGWRKANGIISGSGDDDPIDHEVENYFAPVPYDIKDKAKYLEAQHMTYALYLEDQDYIDYGVEPPRRPKKPWEK